VCAMASATARSSVREPTAEELVHLDSVPAILSWSYLDGDAGFGLLEALGTTVSAPVHELAGVDPSDFSDALFGWRIGADGRPPTPVEKGRARSVHRACRIIAALEYSAEATETWEWNRSKADSAASAAHTSAVLAASQAAGIAQRPGPAPQVVKLSEVADVTK
jgi:hypothetical protein